MMRILIADDSEPVRRGVVEILAGRPNWEVCGEAKDGAEAIAMAKTLTPDLILLDISMPGLGGLDAARILHKEVAAAKILMMSQHDPQLFLPHAREAGVHACVDKSRLSTDLLPAIEGMADLIHK